MKIGNRVLVASAALGLAAAAGFVTAGPLTPPVGAVASTYKTLTQVEPRTDVNTLPGVANAKHIINTPGSYYLTADVVGAAGLNGIIINANNVTLDLNGFSVQGAAASSDGIQISGVRSNVVIKNGIIRGWTGQGVDAADDTIVTLQNLTLTNNTSDGAAVGAGSLVSSCSASANTGNGFSLGEGSAISNSTATTNGINGILLSGAGAGAGTGGGSVTGCTATRNVAVGILAAQSNISDCTASYNGSSGFSATNCSLTNSQARGNAGSGISGTGSIIAHCQSRSNTLDGISAGEGARIESCTSRGNLGDGIEVSKEVTVVDCHVEDNNIDAAGADVGIRLVDTDNRIEGNTVLNNLGEGVFTVAGAIGNIIVGNRASGNPAGDYVIVAGNFVGTVVAAPAAMNAAMNSLINVAY